MTTPHDFTTSRANITAPAVIITIDGPAGTGKSSVAHMLSERLGLEFLDTGAMYRAAALVALREEIAPDSDDLADAVADANIHFDWSGDPPRLMVGEQNVSQQIRDMEVSRIVSTVAGLPRLREVLVQRQRTIASDHPRLVSEGRDQGSVVFPDAALRFFLFANPQVRARRRVEQLIAAGKNPEPNDVLQDILSRDKLDSSRTLAPLVKPQGAVEIDTSDRSLEQVVDLLDSIARDRLPASDFKPPEPSGKGGT